MTHQSPSSDRDTAPELGPHIAGARGRQRTSYERFVKPVVDLVAAAVLVMLLLPVLLAVTVVIWVSLGSPVLLCQQRVGKDGRVFGMYKFRTMLPDRRQRRAPVPPHVDRRQTHKSADDPRHTRLGRFLRATSLDELPQLLNVVRGDMSLVGPRPELADVVEQVYEPWQLQRHLVKPGITGLWQVTQRAQGDAVMHLHTDTDLDYIERLSPRTDLRILLRTPLVLLAGLVPRRGSVTGLRESADGLSGSG